MRSKHFVGRGNKIPYKQTHMRIPLPIKTKVEALVAEYRQSVLNDAVISTVEVSEPTTLESPRFPSKNEVIAKAHEIAKESKKGTKHLLQLVEYIYG